MTTKQLASHDQTKLLLPLDARSLFYFANRNETKRERRGIKKKKEIMEMHFLLGKDNFHRDFLNKEKIRRIRFAK